MCTYSFSDSSTNLISLLIPEEKGPFRSTCYSRRSTISILREKWQLSAQQPMKLPMIPLAGKPSPYSLVCFLSVILSCRQDDVRSRLISYSTSSTIHHSHYVAYKKVRKMNASECFLVYQPDAPERQYHFPSQMKSRIQMVRSKNQYRCNVFESAADFEIQHPNGLGKDDRPMLIFSYLGI